MSEAGIVAQFIDGKRGRIFVILRRPQQEGGRTVLIVPPFAEEMNKCRRMFTEVAMQLAARGVATVLADLYGTGDSEGEFAEADVPTWLDDLARTTLWSQQQGWQVTSLLCVRSGCMLGSRYARNAVPAVQHAVFWQAVSDGERFMNQFLRLRVAASMMEAGGAESVAALRGKLSAGQSVEVAGYELSPQLSADMDGLRLLEEVGPALGSLHWMELVRDAQAPLPGTSELCIEKCRSTGTPVTLHRHAGEPFWTSTEIVVNDALVRSTVEVLSASVQ